MINITSVPKSSNIIVVKGVNFVGASGKKSLIEDIPFSDDETVIDCSASEYLNVKAGQTRLPWTQGIVTIDRPIDIVNPYNNGAKYIYVLSTAFRRIGTDNFDEFTGPLCLYDSNSDEIARLTSAPSLIKTHAVDERVANRNNFNNYIVELVYSLEPAVSQGATSAVFSYCAKPGPFTASESTPYEFANTLINKPFAYFVYEK